MRVQQIVQFLLVIVCIGSLVMLTQGLHAQPDAPVLFQSTGIKGAPAVLLASQSPKTARFLPAPGYSSIQSATFIVNYTGFSAAARAAFQRAVDIWAGEISSPVPIVINATWKPLGDGVLGQATTADYAISSSSAPTPNTIYPIALGNKLAGTDLSPTLPDITAEFNSSLSVWYYGTDGNAPANTYDLVTVVLHEIGHGLGFLGTMQVASGTGGWGLDGYPIIYDRFVVNGSSQQLINTALFPNPSAALATQLQSNNVSFNGPNAVAATGTRPKLYAPSSWEQGSSLSHLDEAAYPTGNSNALMTPILDDGEVIHDIGAITRGVFSDIGWAAQSAPAATSTRTVISSATWTRTAISSTAVAGTATSTGTTAPSGTRKNFLPVVAQGSGSLPTLTPSRTVTQASPTASITRSPTASTTRTATPGGTATRTATVTNGPTSSATSTATSTNTAGPTATSTRTPTATNTTTSTPSSTRTPSPTRTSTPSPTPTITVTAEGT